MEASPKLQVLLGGTEIPVTYLDGRVEQVKIRKVPIADMPRLAQVFGQDMAAEAAFYADRDERWTQNITDDSFAAVFEEGRRQNFTLFKAWFLGKTQELELMGRNTQLNRLIEGAVKEVLEKAPGPR